MAEKVIDTSDAYTKLVVNTRSELIGDYPNITFRIHYEMKIRLTASGSWSINNVDFWFHTAHNKVNLQCNFPYGGTTGVLASGHIDLGITGRLTSHAPGCGVGAGLFSGGSTIIETQTIGAGTLSSSLAYVSHDNVAISISYTSPRNYSYARIFNDTDGVWAISTASNGNNVITGLTPGKEYTFHIELWYRDGKSFYRQIKIKAKTTGFSYLEKDISITLGSRIEFDVCSYSDEFTNDIVVRYEDKIFYNALGVNTNNLKYTVDFEMQKEDINYVYDTIPKALSATGTIEITTYDGENMLGTTLYELLMDVDTDVCKPTLTSFAYRDVSSAPNITNNNQTIVKNVSKVELYASNALARRGASIVSYSMLIGNESVTSKVLPLKSEILTSNSGIQLTVTDSRGLQAFFYKPFTTFIDYDLITLDFIDARRKQDENGTEATLEFSGKVFAGLFGLNINNVIEASYYYREAGSLDYVKGGSDITPALDANYHLKVDIKGDLDALGFSKEKSFEIMVVVNDCFSSRSRTTDTLTKFIGLMYYHDEGIAMGGEYDPKITVNGKPSVLEFWHEGQGRMKAIEEVMLEAETGVAMERITNTELENMLN